MQAFHNKHDTFHNKHDTCGYQNNYGECKYNTANIRDVCNNKD